MELAVFVGSATLVAVAVTVCCEVVFAGAVYKPEAEIAPTAGLTDHVTAVLPAAHATDAVNCCVAEGNSVTLVGEIATFTGGFNITVPVADFVGSATLVAVTVIGC